MAATNKIKIFLALYLSFFRSANEPLPWRGAQIALSALPFSVQKTERERTHLTLLLFVLSSGKFTAPVIARAITRRFMSCVLGNQHSDEMQPKVGKKLCHPVRPKGTIKKKRVTPTTLLFFFVSFIFAFFCFSSSTWAPARAMSMENRDSSPTEGPSLM